MGDLIERLRTMCSHRGDGIATQFVNPDGPEAADRIEMLEQALKPFAGHVGKSGEKVTLSIGKDTWTGTLTTDMFENARAVLSQREVS